MSPNENVKIANDNMMWNKPYYWKFNDQIKGAICTLEKGNLKLVLE